MSNVGSRFAGRHKRASVSRAERQRARSLAMTPQPPVPFMLSSAPPAFPGEVTVPPHRGAVIEPAPADSLSDYTIQAKPKAKPSGKTGTGKTGAAKSGSSKTGSGKSGPKKAATVKQATIPTAAERARSAAARAAQASAAAPSPAAESVVESAGADTIPPATALPQETPARADEPAGTPPAAELAQAPEQPGAAAPAGIAAADALAQPSTAALASPAVIPPQPAAQPVAAATTARPEQRALVRQERGLIARVVAWLGRLAPRKQRASLPKARTRLERPVQPVAPVAAAPQPMPQPMSMSMPIPDAAPPEAALPLKTESILSGRMVLKLSEENSRLRRELEALRAAAERGDNADDDSGDTGKGH